MIKKLRIPLRAVVIILLIAAASVTAVFAASSVNIDAPCNAVITPSDAAGSMNVSWWAPPEDATASLWYGSDESMSGATEVAAVRTISDSSYYAWTASMTGLDAGEVYYYQVGNAGARTQVKSFTAPEISADEATFIYFGDAQYNTYETKDADYLAWGQLVAAAYEANPSAGIGILGGDMVQNGQNAISWDDFLKNAGTFGTLPLLPVPGNHESNGENGKPSQYLSFFNLPSNGPDGFKEEFYSYELGDCHIQFLSSNILSGEQLSNGAMEIEDYETIKQWIASDMNSSDKTWKIVIMHHPAYAVVADGVAAEVLAQWTPVFEEAQVDLVMCGHQHVYMRTKAMHGVTYVMGVSGAKHYATAEVSFDEVQIGEVSNYQVVTSDADTLTMTSFNAQGVQIDAVTLTPKDRTVTPVWHDTPGDINGDDLVDDNDVGALLTAIRGNIAYDEKNDLNGDSSVDVLDAFYLKLQMRED